ncbi:MAG: DNA adenine methylase [Candidatus Hermodarchaeota archaeon]
MNSSKTISHKPHPFLKWAGGKRQLIFQMKKYFPKNFSTFIEPFVGGGAVFFHLLPEKGVLIDINKELINCYIVIKNNVLELIELLKNHKNEKEYYYRIREKDRNLEQYKNLSDVEKASRILYLNRCCYNGLYRVNKKGQFNVPFGRYKNPNFCDKENLLAVSKSLRNIEIIHGSFELCLKFANKGDFVYFDPPYHPLTQTANFTSYSKEKFGKKSQTLLFNVFKSLDERGCKLMLSNSYNKFILELYRDYRIEFLNAKRAINSAADKRGKIKEVLVLN